MILIRLHAVFYNAKIVYPYIIFPQACPIQQLMALRDFVVELSCLQFWNGL